VNREGDVVRRFEERGQVGARADGDLDVAIPAAEEVRAADVGRARQPRVVAVVRELVFEHVHDVGPRAGRLVLLICDGREVGDALLVARARHQRDDFAGRDRARANRTVLEACHRLEVAGAERRDIEQHLRRRFVVQAGVGDHGIHQPVAQLIPALERRAIHCGGFARRKVHGHACADGKTRKARMRLRYGRGEDRNRPDQYSDREKAQKIDGALHDIAP
jgi:hypothetical protein